MLAAKKMLQHAVVRDLRLASRTLSAEPLRAAAEDLAARKEQFLKKKDVFHEAKISFFRGYSQGRGWGWS
jgi:hypothetical protein